MSYSLIHGGTTLVSEMWDEKFPEWSMSDVSVTTISPSYFEFKCFRENNSFFNSIFELNLNDFGLYNSRVSVKDGNGGTIITGIILQENCQYDYKTNICIIRVWDSIKFLDLFLDRKILQDYDYESGMFDNPNNIIQTLIDDINNNVDGVNGNLISIYDSYNYPDEDKTFRLINNPVTSHLEAMQEEYNGIIVSGSQWQKHFGGFINNQPKFLKIDAALLTDGDRYRWAGAYTVYLVSYPGVIVSTKSALVSPSDWENSQNNASLQDLYDAIEQSLADNGEVVGEIEENPDWLNSSHDEYEGFSGDLLVSYTVDSTYNVTANTDKFWVYFLRIQHWLQDEYPTYRELLKHFLECGKYCIISSADYTGNWFGFRPLQLQTRKDTTKTPITISRSDIIKMIKTIDPVQIKISSLSQYQDASVYKGLLEDEYSFEIPQDCFDIDIVKDYEVRENSLIEIDNIKYWVYSAKIGYKDNIIQLKTRKV